MEKHTIESQNEDQKGVKRAWVTPDIEIISADNIQGGLLAFLNEASTFIGDHGTIS